MVIATLYMAIILVVLLLMRRSPGAALIVAFNMFALDQWAQASSAFFQQRQALTNIVAGTLVLLGVFAQLRRDQIRRPIYPKEAWLIAALFLYSLLSILWAPEFATSIALWKESLPYLITIVFLAPLTIQKPDDLRTAFGGTLVVGSLVAVLLLLTVDWEGRQIVLARDAFGEATGGNPLTVGQLGGTLLILSILFRFRSRSRYLVIAKWSAGMLGLALVARSGSRGQLGGAIVVVGCFWAIANSSRSLWKPLVSAAVLASLVILAKIVMDYYWAGDVRFDASYMEGDFAGRLRNALILLEHWMKSPLSIVFGLGNSASYDSHILGIYPHIVPLEILGEEGAAGFVLFCAIVVGAAASGFRAFRSNWEDPEVRSLLACVAGLWMYSFLLINKQGSLLLSQEFFLHTILLAKFGQIAATTMRARASRSSVDKFLRPRAPV